MNKVRNKWNGRVYTVLKNDGNEVVLQRHDGTTFRIQKAEYFFSYSEKTVDKVN